MYTYDDYRYSESRMEGKREGRREGRDETILQIFINMKNKNLKDEDICSLIGISMHKLRQIKKIERKTNVLQKQLV